MILYLLRLQKGIIADNIKLGRGEDIEWSVPGTPKGVPYLL